jgi:transcription elongation factor Elf1
MIAVMELECPCCGEVAIVSATGYFQEDEGERCMSCGAKGHVEVDEEDETPRAWWSSECEETVA